MNIFKYFITFEWIDGFSKRKELIERLEKKSMYSQPLHGVKFMKGVRNPPFCFLTHPFVWSTLLFSAKPYPTLYWFFINLATHPFKSVLCKLWDIIFLSSELWWCALNWDQFVLQCRENMVFAIYHAIFTQL